MNSPPNKLTLEDWKKRISIVNPNMHILNEILPQGTKEDPFICHCDDCGATFDVTKTALYLAYSRRKNGLVKIKWCPVCCGQLVVYGINDIYTLRPDLNKYFVNINDAIIHTEHSSKKVLCRCPDCKSEKMISISELSVKGFHCDICSDHISYPNKICRLLLKELPVDYCDTEFIDTWTQGKKYDGFFQYNNKKYLLEFDGKQHFIDSSWSNKEEQMENDALKTRLAKENGYNLIRINCIDSSYDFIISQIFQSKLSEIFDLNSVDWDKIFKESCKNIVFEVIDLYKKNMKITKIAEFLQIDRHTVRNYLKTGDKLGLVDYIPRIKRKEEIYP